MTDEEYADAQALAGMQLMAAASDAAIASVVGKAICAYDLQPPAQLLTPAFSPMKGHRPPPRVKLDPAPEGQVWVYVWWDGEYGAEYINWEQWCEPSAPEYTAKNLRLVTIEQLAKWEAAKAAYRAVEREVEELRAA